MREMKGELPSKVLVVVCQTGMGDAVESLPSLGLIRDYWPDVHLGVGYFVEKQREILEVSPHISELIRLEGSVRYAWRAMKGFVYNIKAMQGYERILFLYKKDAIAWPMLLAARLTGARVLYQRDYRYKDRRRNTFSDFPEQVFYQIVVSNLLLRLPLTRLRKPTVYLLDRDRRFADDFLNRWGLGHRPVAIINTQSLHPDWGIEKYARVANALADWGADVLINGGSEKQVREFKRVAHLLMKRVFPLEGPSPRELAAIIAKCDLYIGAPNGPACSALALGTPTLMLMGPGEHGYPGQERVGPTWWPWDSRHSFLSKIDWCKTSMQCNCHPEWRPVKRMMKRLGVWKPWKRLRKAALNPDGGHRVSTKQFPCFEAITVDEVVEAAKQHLVRSPTAKAEGTRP